MSKTKPITVNIGGAIATGTPKSGRNPYSLWYYNGRRYAAGLGRMHAQEGFPLSESLDMCAREGIIPARRSTLDELKQCGTLDPEAVLKHAVSDMCEKMPESWAVFGWM